MTPSFPATSASGSRGCMSLLGATVATLLLLGTAATQTAAELTSYAGTPDYMGTMMYYPTTCRGTTIAFAGFVSDSFLFRSITVIADASTVGGIRIMAPFKANNGDVFTVEEGFDPCQYTTCHGVTCNTPGFVLTQEYYDLSQFTLSEKSLSFPNYQRATHDSSPRCTCRDPSNQMKREGTSYSPTDNITIDPNGPSAEKSDAACEGLACDADPSTAASYYLLSDDPTPTGCHCCARQPALLAPSSSSKPTCGQVKPTIAAESSLETGELLDYVDGEEDGNDRVRYFIRQCGQAGPEIAFSTFASQTSPRTFGAVADASTVGGIRIMAPFKANNGDVFTVEEGFDPCQYTTCHGVTCNTPGFVVTQEYSRLDAYTSNGRSLSFPNYQETAYTSILNTPSPRCTCRDPSNQMKREGTTDNITIDPNGPSAEKSDAACEGLACDADPSTTASYYLLSDDQTPTGCHCCARQPALLAPSSSSKPTCGQVKPTIAAESSLETGELLDYVDGEEDYYGRARYFIRQCGQAGPEIAFSTFASQTSPRTFGAVADASTVGGIRIMAPFKANNGDVFTVEEGFDPCQYTTCHGVTCNTPGFILTQEYYDLSDYTSSGRNLSFPNYQEAAYGPSPRCTCRDPSNQMKREGTSYSPTDNITIDPNGPSAEKSDAACEGLACDADPSTAASYYLLSDDQTPTGCHCCARQPALLAPSSSSKPTCGQVKPTIAAESSLETGELLDYVDGEEDYYGRARYFIRQCGQAGPEIAFSTFISDSSSSPTFGAVADASTVGGIRIMAPFKANNGDVFTVEEGFDPCQYTTCDGVTCNTPGFVVTQEYYDLSDSIFSRKNLSFPLYRGTDVHGYPRCTCRDPSNQMAVEAVSNVTVDPTGPSAEQDDPVCSMYMCSTDEEVDKLYYVVFTKSEVTGCQCCKRNPTLLAPKYDVPEVCGELTVLKKPLPPSSSSSPNPVEPASSSGSGASTSPSTWQVTFLKTLTRACPAATLQGVDYATLVAGGNEVCCTFRGIGVTAGVSGRYCGSQLTLLGQGPGTLSCSGEVGGRSLTCCGAVDWEGDVRGNGRSCEGH